MTPFMTRDDILAAGEHGGAYLSGLGKTDLATLTAEEWATFLIVIVNEANMAAGQRIVNAWTIPVGAEG